jgi:hypothetical protein
LGTVEYKFFPEIMFYDGNVNYTATEQIENALRNDIQIHLNH